MNLRNLIMSSLFLMASTGVFATPGFKAGTKFSVQPVRGSVTLYCMNGSGGGRATRYYSCNQNYISPAAYSYFVNDSGVVAKKVKLTVNHEDGSVKKKTKKYNSKKGRSKGRFNLWIASLFQRPILEYGTNDVSYQMISKSGDIVESGNFSVEVERKPTIHCAHRSFNAYNNDCSFPDRFCRRVYTDGYSCH